jgi:hypothetical protein
MLLNTPTHEVTNQAVPFEDVDYFEADVPLREALEREGAGWAVDRVRDAGIVAGSAEAQAHGRRAERNEPRLLTHDRYGHRLDAVELDPSWHWLLRGAVEREIHALPWRDPRPGAHVARAALELLWTQADAGVMCPVSMTYSAVPALRLDPEMARDDGEAGWLRRARQHHPRPAGRWRLVGADGPQVVLLLPAVRAVPRARAGSGWPLLLRGGAGSGHGVPAPQGQARNALAAVE